MELGAVEWWERRCCWQWMVLVGAVHVTPVMLMKDGRSWLLSWWWELLDDDG